MGFEPMALSVERVLEFSAEWIVPQDAQVERGSSPGRGRPVHQLSEVKKKAGLHVIFLGFALGVRGPARCHEDQRE
jgi:hypothetical protein